MTPEEFSERRKRLGATDVAAVLGLSPWRSAYEVWLEKVGRLEQWNGNAATRAGKRLESAVLDHAEEDLGQTLERNVVAWAPDGLPISATLDGRVPFGPPVEVKTSGIVGPVYGRWGDVDSDEIPDVYLVQVTVQMLCTAMDVAWLYALLGGRGIVRYRVVRDDEIVRHLSVTCSEWWQRHVVDGIEPERKTPVPLEVVKRLRRQPNKVIEFNETTTELVRVWEDAKGYKRDAEKAVEQLQAEILLRLSDAEAATMQDGRTFLYMSENRRGYTVAPTTVRIARVRKAR